MGKYNICTKYNPNKHDYFVAEKVDNNTFNIIFGSRNNNIKKMYENSLEYIPNFLEPLFNSLEGKKIKYRTEKFDFFKLINNLEFHELISQTTTNEIRNRILKEIKIIEDNKIALFLYDLRNLSKIYNKNKELPFSLLERFEAIKNGLLNKRLINNILYFACYSTYSGFFIALKENKIYTTKVKIDGEIRRVFIKTPIHNGLGGNKMFIDPKTFKVYAFETDNKGKIKKFLLRIDPEKGILNFNSKKPFPLMTSEKKVLSKLKEEINSYIKRTLENQKKYRLEFIEKRKKKKMVQRRSIRR